VAHGPRSFDNSAVVLTGPARLGLLLTALLRLLGLLALLTLLGLARLGLALAALLPALILLPLLALLAITAAVLFLVRHESAPTLQPHRPSWTTIIRRSLLFLLQRFTDTPHSTARIFNRAAAINQTQPRQFIKTPARPRNRGQRRLRLGETLKPALYGRGPR
jgi:hypothetical protein